MMAKDPKKSGSASLKKADLTSELERQLEHQRLKIDRLTEENKKLTKQVQTEKRVRYAAKNLVVGTDKAIQAQIDKLNQAVPKGKKTVRYDKLDYTESNLKELWLKTSQADLAANYTRKKITRPKKRLMYQPVKTIYFIPRNVVAFGLKSGIKLLRGKTIDEK